MWMLRLSCCAPLCNYFSLLIWFLEQMSHCEAVSAPSRRLLLLLLRCPEKYQSCWVHSPYKVWWWLIVRSWTALVSWSRNSIRYVYSIFAKARRKPYFGQNHLRFCSSPFYLLLPSTLTVHYIPKLSIFMFCRVLTRQLKKNPMRSTSVLSYVW